MKNIEMNNIEKILEFDKIKEKWSEFAFTDRAKQQIAETEPFLSEAELLLKLAETTEAKVMIESAGSPPLVSFEGISEMLTIAKKGGCLTASQLENIEVALVAVKRLKEYLNRCKQFAASLPYYDENLDSLDEIREMIRVQIRNGRVDDYASKLLRSLRADIERSENKMREKADSVMKANKECMSDSFSTIRNGHICIPVKKEYKFRIAGSVIDKSSTGNTLFIEPVSVAKYFEELQLLKVDEENEERRILYALTGFIADNAEIMEENVRMVEKLDFIFSKGKLSLELGGAEPKINTDRRIVIQNVRHPLMDKNIAVPLQFEIGNGINGVVITGPNTGGKTVAIKTVALNCMMAQCGLHVAAESADICMNSNFLCDIGDGQNISENLSTFSAHINNVLDILKKVNKESLVIMDELGSGTDPTEGMGIAVAILDELKKSGALFLVTTHYPEVKTYAEREEGIVNARMTFDKESLKPLYQLVIGEAGESCAFYIAKRLGMPLSMLRRAAKEAYGEAYVLPDEFITGVIPHDVNAEVKVNVSEEINTLSGTEAEANVAVGAEAGGKENVSAGANAKAESNILAEANTATKVHVTGSENEIKKEYVPRIQKKKTVVINNQAEAKKFRLGDSVMVYPDKKIGIVCQTSDEKGVLRVQLQNKKIYINHKRIKLVVAAEEMYPENYDFSIIFDSVENRKLRHKMERKFVEGEELKVED